VKWGFLANCPAAPFELTRESLGAPQSHHTLGADLVLHLPERTHSFAQYRTDTEKERVIVQTEPGYWRFPNRLGAVQLLGRPHLPSKKLFPTRRRHRTPVLTAQSRARERRISTLPQGWIHVLPCHSQAAAPRTILTPSAVLRVMEKAASLLRQQYREAMAKNGERLICILAGVLHFDAGDQFGETRIAVKRY
jgi:hypothetical protein